MYYINRKYFFNTIPCPYITFFEQYYSKLLEYKVELFSNSENSSSQESNINSISESNNIEEGPRIRRLKQELTQYRIIQLQKEKDAEEKLKLESQNYKSEIDKN